MIYLDHAAATPLSDAVQTAMQPFWVERFYNPSATYLAAQDVRNDLDAARTAIASELGARSSEILFTAGGTESDNLAISGIMGQYPDATMVVSAIEHDAVLKPAQLYNCTVAAVNEQGIVDVSALEQQITDSTVLVSIMYANNEVGTVQPLRQIAGLLKKVRDARRHAGHSLPLYFHTDACQAANYLDLHVSRLGVDLMTLNGGKIYGPKQSGVLYVSHTIQLQPLLLGGGQERGLRSGTENIAGCIGFAAALSETSQLRPTELERLRSLQSLAYDLIQTQLPHAVINGSRKHRLPNNIHLTLPGYDNERLLMQLDEQGILAAAGSACSASSDDPSHVLQAMGVSDADAQSSLRFTMGRSTTEADVRHLIETLASLL